jgi:peptidoglycan/LPS O-acetylase OafA/YrhL
VIVFTFEWHLLLTLLASVVFPLLVGLVTTRETNGDRKAVLLAALSVLAPLAAELAHALSTGTPYDLGLALFTGLGSFLIAVGLHYGLWRPTHVTEKVQAVGVVDRG